MRFRRVVLAGTVSICLVAVLGAGPAAAVTDGSNADPSASPSSGLLGGVTKTVRGVLGQGKTPSDPSTPAPHKGTQQDPSGLLKNLLPKNKSGNGSSGASGGGNDSNGKNTTSNDPGGANNANGSKGATDPAADFLALIPTLPLPKLGENVPDNLCLPQQLGDALPASIPRCLNLEVCKQGLIRDLDALPTVKLTGLAQYVQRVLQDIPECLLSLLPPLPNASGTPTPSHSPPAASPPRIHRPTPKPARPATPVTQEPSFTG